MATNPWHKRWHGKDLAGMRGLSLEMRGAYQTILDLIYDHGGPIRFDERRLCSDLDCDIRVLKRVIKELVEAEKIRLWHDGRTIFVVNDKALEVLQEVGFSEDTSAELPADFRDKFLVATRQLSRTSDKIPNENSAAKKSISEKPSPRREKIEDRPPIVPQAVGLTDLLGEPNGVVRDDVKTAFDLWNQTASILGLPRALDLTPKRRAAIGARIKSAGLEGWREALEAVKRNKFCRGMVPPNNGYAQFRADIDFVAKPDKFTALREGKFPPNIDGPEVSVVVPIDPKAKWRKVVRQYFYQPFYWDTMEYGLAKPGDTGCKVPQEIQDEFAAEIAARLERLKA